MLVVCLMYSTIMIPFQVAFDVESRNAMFVIDTDAAFWMDIALHFRLGFLRSSSPFNNMDDSAVVMNGRLIARRYLRSWFAVDLAAVFPITAILTAATSAAEQSPSSRLARLLRLTRLPRLLRLFKFVRVTSYLNFVREADSNPRPLPLAEPWLLKVQPLKTRTFESRPGRIRTCSGSFG